MTRPVRRSPPGLLLLCLFVLSGCSSDPDDLASSETAPLLAPAASNAVDGALPTEALSQTSPEEQAAAVAAVAAYDGSWALDVQARRDPGAKPNWQLDYRQYFTDPALSVALGQVYGMRDAGLASPTGEPSRDPRVVAVDLDRQSVEIVDCVDFRTWPEIFVATGEQNSIPEPPFVIQARVIYDPAAGRWLVTEQTPHPDQPC